MGKNKTATKKTEWNKFFLVIGCSAIVGLVIGFISGAFLETYTIKLDLIVFITGLFAFFISYFIHILFHEVGHLIFGFLTGYTYVSFRIGSLTLIKEEGTIKRKRMNLPGTGGQCLMSPPDYKNGNFPFVLYNLGGILINILFSILAFGVVVNNPFLSTITIVLLSAFALAGLFTALTNGVPMKIGGMPNDGYNLYLMFKEEENKIAFFMQLKMNALMTQGKRLRDIPLKTMRLEGKKDFSNPLKVSIYLLEYNWYLDQLSFDEARTCIAAFDQNEEDLPVVYKNEIDCERLFLELIQKADPFIVKNLYTEELQKYIKITTDLPNKKRLMMAYEAFYQKNEQQATEYYNQLLKTAAMYPVKAEAEMEVMLGECVKEKMKTRTVVE